MHEFRFQKPSFSDEANGPIRLHNIMGQHQKVGGIYRQRDGRYALHGITDDITSESDHDFFKTIDSWPHLAKIIPDFVFGSQISALESQQRVSFLQELCSKNRIVYKHLMSGELQEDLDNLSIGQNKTEAYLRDSSFITLAANLVNKPDPFSRFMLGLITSQTTSSTLPSSLQEILHSAIRNDLSMTVLANYTDKDGKHWAGCPQTEGYLEDSMRFNNSVVVNGFLVVKAVSSFSGEEELRGEYGTQYPMGLCIQNTTTPQETFVEGGYYSPLPDTRRQITASVANHNRIVELSRASEWVFIRDSGLFIENSKRDALLLEANKYAQRLRM